MTSITATSKILKRERRLLAWSHPEELMKISWALLGKESAQESKIIDLQTE